MEYPERVDASVQSVEQGEGRVSDETKKFASYPGSIKDPSDPETSADVYRAADEAGRSEAYVRAARDNDAVRSFMEADDGLIGKKVAGGVQFTAKQQGCSADLGGAAAGTLKRTVDMQLEERLKNANEAHRIIDENEEAVGKQNSAALHTQADEIAHASYVAYIELPSKRGELRALMAERDKVSSTLRAKIKADKAKVASATTSAADKKAAEARLVELEASQDKLEQGRQAHEALLKDLDKRVADAQKQYDTALDDLLEAVSGKPKASVEAEGAVDIKAE